MGLGLGIGNAFYWWILKMKIYNKYTKIDDYLTMKVFPQFA